MKHRFPNTLSRLSLHVSIVIYIFFNQFNINLHVLKDPLPTADSIFPPCRERTGMIADSPTMHCGELTRSRRGLYLSVLKHPGVVQGILGLVEGLLRTRVGCGADVDAQLVHRSANYSDILIESFECIY